MTDILTEIARNERRTKELIREGTILKCPICWTSIKNNEDKLKEHFNEYHTYNQIIKSYSEFWVMIWKKDLKSFWGKE